MKPIVTAVVCTRNRSVYLKKAVDSLCRQNLATEKYEIVVVDNGSSDDTARLVTEIGARAPNVRYLHEPVLGLSQARNTGWQAARGEYVAFLDDDAIAAPGWLESALRCFDTVTPRPGCVTGKIEPIWERPRPGWVDDRLLFAFSITDWSDSPMFLTDEEWMAGCNMSFPRRLLEEVGGFFTELGRHGANLLSDEEHIMRLELEARGYGCYYDPAVLVYHHVPRERTTKAWLRRRAFWQGVSTSRRAVLCDRIGMKQRAGVLGGLLRRMLGTPWIVANMLRVTDDPRRFALQCRTWNDVGQILTLLTFR